MIKAILWDLDGVLIDSEKIVYKRWSATYKELGYVLPPDLFDKTLGLRPSESFNFINKELGILPQLSFDQFYEMNKKRRGVYPSVPLVPHIEGLLQALYKKYLMAVVTSSDSDWLERMLKPIPYTVYFLAFVTGEDIRHPKPHPEPYLKAIKKFKVLPKESVVIEDASYGIKSGKQAGAVVIARRSKHNKGQDFSLADYVVEDLREIPNILKRI